MPIAFMELCETFKIDKGKCERLQKAALAMCPVVPKKSGVPRTRSGRKISNWQLCLKEEMTGKKFNPNRIRELSKLYKQGSCPTKKYVENYVREQG